jgi:hypothetical protein
VLVTFTVKPIKGVSALDTPVYDNPGTIIDVVSAGSNIDFNNVGGWSRRGGFIKRYSGTPHSFDQYNHGYFVEGGNLKKYSDTAYTASTIATLLSNNRMWYCKYLDKVFCSNAVNIGYIKQDVYTSFPVTTEPFKSRMLPGHIIEYYHNRLYTANHEGITYSDAGNLYVIDIRGFRMRMATEPTLLAAVDDGLYVSDGERIMFWKGNDPDEMVQIVVAEYGAIKWSQVHAERLLVNEGLKTNVVLFNTEQGMCIGGAGGELVNLTIDKIAGDTYLHGASLFRINNNIPQFLTVGIV